MAHSIYITAEHEALREQVARFVAREVEPHGTAWEKQGFVPREVLRKLGGMGLLGVTYPTEYGGAGADALTNLVFAEALSQTTFAGFAVTVLVHTDMASPHLVHAGSARQKEKYLPGIIRGETIAAIAMTEADAGSDLAGMRTHARRLGGNDGDGWVLNGSKMFITNGVHGDLYFVAAKTDRDAPGSRGISMFIVEKDTPGFRVGRALEKTGWLCSDTAELVFEDCRLPADNLLGEENRGFHALTKNMQTERIAISAMAVSLARRALDLTVEYTCSAKRLAPPCSTAKQFASASPCSMPKCMRPGNSSITAPG